MSNPFDNVADKVTRTSLRNIADAMAKAAAAFTAEAETIKADPDLSDIGRKRRLTLAREKAAPAAEEDRHIADMRVRAALLAESDHAEAPHVAAAVAELNRLQAEFYAAIKV